MDIKTLQKDMIAAMKNKRQDQEKNAISALISGCKEKWLLMKDAEMIFQGQKW